MPGPIADAGQPDAGQPDAGDVDGGAGDGGLPQVFLTIDESNIIDTAVAGRVAVSGCGTVAQVQIFQGNTFLADVLYAGTPTPFVLPPGVFSNLYTSGIALQLTLKAKVVCGDGRTNISLPMAVRFFPVAQRFTAGAPIVPDVFVAEGGGGAAPTTFLGCVATNTGTMLARVNVSGAVVAFNDTLPFDCTTATQISARSAVTGTRWVLEPGQGAYAINGALQIQKISRSVRTRRMGTGARGTAVLWEDGVGAQNRIVKLDPVPSTTNDWSMPFVGLMNSVPRIDDGAGSAVWVSRWVFDPGARRADIIPLKHDLNTGVMSGLASAILSQQYPLSSASQPMTEGVFSADGAFFTVPVLAFDPSGNTSTTVFSCSTVLGLCQGAARRWTSPIFPVLLPVLVPSSQGNTYAAAGSTGVYFLNAQSGTTINLGARAIQPSAGLSVVGVQAGGGTDFYVLAAPASDSSPTELVSTDAPASGELWRLQFGSGASAAASLHLAVDEGGVAWVRVGPDLVKLLPLTEYRAARGPTILP